MIMRKINLKDITLKGWLNLWVEFMVTVIRLVVWPLILIAKGFYWLGKTRPLLTCILCLSVCILVDIVNCVHYRLERDEARLVIDSLSKVNDKLKAADRYEIGFSDGMAARASQETKN